MVGEGRPNEMNKDHVFANVELATDLLARCEICNHLSRLTSFPLKKYHKLVCIRCGSRSPQLLLPYFFVKETKQSLVSELESTQLPAGTVSYYCNRCEEVHTKRDFDLRDFDIFGCDVCWGKTHRLTLQTGVFYGQSYNLGTHSDAIRDLLGETDTGDGSEVTEFFSVERSEVGLQRLDQSDYLPRDMLEITEPEFETVTAAIRGQEYDGFIPIVVGKEKCGWFQEFHSPTSRCSQCGQKTGSLQGWSEKLRHLLTTDLAIVPEQEKDEPLQAGDIPFPRDKMPLTKPKQSDDADGYPASNPFEFPVLFFKHGYETCLDCMDSESRPHYLGIKLGEDDKNNLGVYESDYWADEYDHEARFQLNRFNDSYVNEGLRDVDEGYATPDRYSDMDSYDRSDEEGWFYED